MRTALRTYHPVPSLQKADANLQDAPRIKNILKACSLKDEATTNMPVTPAELRARAVGTATELSRLTSLPRITGNRRYTLHKHRQSSLRSVQSLHSSFPSPVTIYTSITHSHVPDRGT
jgi:Ino eighty subunit 1